MPINHMLRTVRMTVMSSIFALIVIALLTFGAANAQTVSRAHASQSSDFPRAGSTCSSNTVQIKLIRFGRFTVAAFSCNQVTVKAGVPVVFVNSTQFNEFVVNSDFSIFIFVPHQGSAMLPTSQPGQLHVFIYGSPSRRAHLTITVGS